MVGKLRFFLFFPNTDSIFSLITNKNHRSELHLTRRISPHLIKLISIVKFEDY